MKDKHLLIFRIKPDKSVSILVSFIVFAALVIPLTINNISKASGTVIVTDAFTSASTGSPAGWSIGGNQATAPVCNGNTQLTMVDGPDADTAVDRLRLIDQCTQGETGYALYDVAQTTSAGLDIRFNISVHGFGGTGCPVNPSDNYNSTSTNGGSNSGNTCQADGFVFYLKQGSNTATGGTSLGQAGGSLGYSPVNADNGLSGALLGVGFDSYGNFYQNPYAGSDCSSPTNSTSQYARRSLIIRGPQGDSRLHGYCRISTDADRTSNSRNIGVDIASSGIFSTDRTGAAIRITIDTEDTSSGRTNGTGTVYIATAGTTDWTGINSFAKFELPSELNPQTNSTFKFGFVAGTGGGTMYTDIWNAGVQSIRDLPEPEFVTSSLCLSTQENLNLSLQGREGVAPYSYSLQSGSLPTGISLTSAGLLSGTPTTTGSYDFTLRLTDSQSPVHTADKRFQGTTTSSPCDSTLSWTLAGNQASSPSSVTASCSSGSVSNTAVNNYRIVTFSAPASGNGSCTWTPPDNVFEIEALVVGGGGGGGYDAGGGGGGGGTAWHTALKINANSYAISIGGGGAAGPVTATASAKTGSTGGASSIAQSGTSIISANGGAGGKGCYWNGSICGSGSSSNLGGSGGTSSGPTGVHAITGAAGGNGVWNASTSNEPQSGGAGPYVQTSGALRYYGGGGGGSGASHTPGTGGQGGGASGTSSSSAPSNATASTGGGGGGGNASGSNGGSGVVIIKYAFREATNVANPVVSVNFSGTNTSTMNSNGTVVRQSTTLTGSDCGDTWTSSSAFSLTNGSDSTTLERGKCYRWSYDTDTAFGGTYAADSASIQIRSSATSPILIIPPEVTIRVPSVLRTDPRVSERTMPGLVLTSGDSALVCFYESEQTTLTGIGSVSASPALKFDIATLGSTETSANSVTITGDQSAALTALGSAGNLATAFTNTKIYLSSSSFSANKYLLIRAVPTVSGFTSTCNSASSGLYPIDSGARLISLEPYGLTQTVRKGVIPLR
jgi:hypothetical protein